MITFDFKHNGSWHNDIFFQLDAFTKTCDSYYFLIDHKYSDEETLDKTISVIVLLLDQWIEALKNLKNKDVIYLPYDFSDQYTACIRVYRNGDSYELTSGFSKRGGWLSHLSYSRIGGSAHRNSAGLRRRAKEQRRGRRKHRSSDASQRGPWQHLDTHGACLRGGRACTHHDRQPHTRWDLSCRSSTRRAS